MVIDPAVSAGARRHDPLRIFALAMAALILAGETATLVLTDKFWPLGADDLAIAIGMAALCLRPLERARLVLMLGAWCFELGSLYTTFFTRIDPHGGSGERLGALIVLMGASALGLVWTLRRISAANEPGTCRLPPAS